MWVTTVFCYPLFFSGGHSYQRTAYQFRHQRKRGQTSRHGRHSARHYVVERGERDSRPAQSRSCTHFAHGETARMQDHGLRQIPLRDDQAREREQEKSEDRRSQRGMAERDDRRR